MNRLCVLKDVAYAAKVGGGVIASMKEVNLLVPGAIAFFTPAGTLLTAANAAATIADVKDVIIASGRTLDNQIIASVPRKLVDINRGDYIAPVKPVITVGALTIGAADEGEVFINVSDISYTSARNVRTAYASVYKKASVGIEATVDALVAKLNKAGSFVVAAKTGVSPNFSVTITPKDFQVSIEASIGGLIEGDPNSVTTAMVYGAGDGVDMLQLEKDFSVEEGNGNYTEYTSEFYSRGMEVDITKDYDQITLLWEGIHSTPSSVKNVMHNKVIIAPVTDATPNALLAQDTANLMGILALIFGNAYTSTAGAEIGTDDGTNHDGVSGN